ncbi:L-threonylcarbamoyladenylate synthase [Brachybacterium sp. sponge]|uniref:L-threonylcarbamoyladenylate synthase n=1 Tax=Brachybacterium sp. sponge TaxID=1775432 RepID=UPI0007A55832|nr:L-threonylcarbamoyladenylate synthase [Brachybacterium sp. sponge]
MSVHDTQNPETREDALAAAVDAVRGGGLIVLPTDTVYGIGADAFTPQAVQDLLEAKGRGRDTPPPVLIGDHAVLMALATDLPEYVEDLTDALWPGALTIILTAQPSLTWDLGETRGTVALRMPEDETALELLRRTGPLAVSSANRHGKPAATSVLDAATQLGDAVEVYLDGGAARIGASSTILDATVTPAEIVREGAITKQQIIDVVGDIFTAPEPEPSEEEPEDAAGEQGEGGETGTSTESAEGAASAGDPDAATAGEADGEDPAPSVLDLPSEPELESVPQGPAETPLGAPGEAAAAPSDLAPSASEPATSEPSTAGSSTSESSASESPASESSASGSTAPAPEDRPDDGPARPEHMPG